MSDINEKLEIIVNQIQEDVWEYPVPDIGFYHNRIKALFPAQGTCVECGLNYPEVRYCNPMGYRHSDCGCNEFKRKEK